jgi:hypothetical protein
MCTTVRYYFNCQHPATHRFRNNTCEFSNSRACRIRDANSQLKFPCRRCLLRQGFRRQIPAELECHENEQVWHIPSRCFVDVGFRTLDPFADDASEPVSPKSPATTILSPMTQKPVSPWPRSPMDERSKCAKLFAKVMRFQKVSPCCEERTRRGAIPAVRCEELNTRIEGRVMDDDCESIE